MSLWNVWRCVPVRSVCAASALGAMYHLAPGGDDRNPGTNDRPWATLRARRARVGPGMLCALSEYPGVLQPQRAGEADAPIIVRAAERHRAVLTGPEDGYAVVLQDTAHIRLEGLAFRLKSPRGGWVFGQRAQSLEFVDLLMDGGNRGDEVRLLECADVRFSDCAMLNGRAGNMVHISESARLTLESCELSGSAHALLLFLPDRTNRQVVIRGCVFAGRTGRTVLLDSIDRLLFENNIIVRSLDGGRCAGSRFSAHATNSIFRGNRVYDNWGAERYPSTLPRDARLRAVRLYNNVFHGNTRMRSRCATWRTINVTDAVFANNVFAGMSRLAPGVNHHPR